MQFTPWKKKPYFELIKVICTSQDFRPKYKRTNKNAELHWKLTFIATNLHYLWLDEIFNRSNVGVKMYYPPGLLTNFQF